VISPVDVLCLAIWAGLIFLEGQRGIIPALADFLCVLVGLVLVRIGYVPLSENMRPSAAYLLLLCAVVVLTAILSIYLSRRLKVQVTAVEAAIGGALGLSTGVLLSYAIFEWLTIRYGGGSSIVSNSLLHWAISELSGLHALADFYRKLTGK